MGAAVFRARVRELPYRLAAHIAASEAGQMAASDYVQNSPKNRLR